MQLSKPDPSKVMAAAAAAKAAQIAAGFGIPVSLPSHIAPTPAIPVVASASGSSFRPAPLRLDASGREVDEKGNVISRPVQVEISFPFAFCIVLSMLSHCN